NRLVTGMSSAFARASTVARLAEVCAFSIFESICRLTPTRLASSDSVKPRACRIWRVVSAIDCSRDLGGGDIGRPPSTRGLSSCPGGSLFSTTVPHLQQSSARTGLGFALDPPPHRLRRAFTDCSHRHQCIQCVPQSGGCPPRHRRLV